MDTYNQYANELELAPFAIQPTVFVVDAQTFCVGFIAMASLDVFNCEFEATAGSEYDSLDESDFSSEDENVQPAPTEILDAGDHEASTSTTKTGHDQSMAWLASSATCTEKPHAFAGNSGIQMPFAENARELDILEAFLPVNFVQNVVEITNIYAADLLSQANLSTSSRIKQLCVTDSD